MSDVRSRLPFECDLVLKGGVTSGIVYPPAIVEIARDHRLRSVGGSSAGAIGAVAAAAAELGRETGGFETLADLPGRLAATDTAGRTLLERLFAPAESTRTLYDAFWSARQPGSPAARVRRVVGVLWRDRGGVSRTAVLVLAAVGVLLALAAGAVAVAGPGALLAAGPLVVVGLAAAAVLLVAIRVGSVLADAPDVVRDNSFGVVSGLSDRPGAQGGLTAWLHATVQELAGRPDGPPVTYGDLGRIGVDLVTTTTNLTLGTSTNFPQRADAWAFRRSELEPLLPPDVLQHLVDHAERPEPGSERALAAEAAGLVCLPAPEDLPILLGARISLSFPLLVSALPLHAWLPVPGPDGGWELRWVRCWFSDGGIASNLPVHLFDRPLPTRPTYAINLASGADPAAPPEDNVVRPLDPTRGRLPPVTEVSTVGQLLVAVLNTMQSWSDNARSRVVGQRDRICTVRLADGEGGLNLDMGPAEIQRVAARGHAAGADLASIRRGTDPAATPEERAASPDPLDHQWERHRFVRYRAFLAGTASYVADAARGMRAPLRPTYAELGDQAVRQPWQSYRRGWSGVRSREAQDLLARVTPEAVARFTTGAPRDARIGPVVVDPASDPLVDPGADPPA
ncbi:hypothetical protein [Nocardioides sp. SYSU D00038]|uniref:hypothetical protein n=1 Tax=Nocardioides sp. SYSU D00038 TaxID=2812554 RepID=UPI00196878F0|nr:hypothetical protein [Nocardioides sp. SYSU D00038]